MRPPLRVVCLVALAGCSLQPWRTEAPEPVTQVSLTIPAYFHARLPNGLELYAHQDNHLPLVTVRAAVRASLTNVPLEQAGLMELLYDLMVHGDEEVEKELDALGTAPTWQVTADGATLGVTISAQYIGEAMRVVSKMLRSPKLDEGSLEGARRQLLTRKESFKPSSLQRAEQTMLAALYGESHPWAIDPRRVAASLGKLGISDVKGAYQRFIGPSSVAIVVVGRVNPIMALGLTRHYLEDWTAAPATLAAPLPASMKRREILVVPQKGLSQTLILLGGIAVPAGHPDECPLRMAADVVSARVNQRLRTEWNVSYGVSASVSTHRGGGHLILRTSVQADATGDGLAIIVRELEEMQTHELSRSFLPKMRLWQLWSLVGTFAGNEGTGFNAAALFWRRLPIDYYRNQLDAIQQVNEERVQSAMERYFRPDRLQIVLAGDPETIARQLHGSGLGTLREITLP